MPVVGIPVDYLKRCIGPQDNGRETIDSDRLVGVLHSMGCDIEEFAELKRFRCAACESFSEVTENEGTPATCEQCGLSFKDNPDALVDAGTVESIRMDLLAVRPDIFDPGGLGRAVRAYISAPTDDDIGNPTTATVPTLAPASYTVTIDPAFGERPLGRPHITAAIVRGLTLTSDRIRIFMKLQENLHWALGRDRKRAAIGMYDLSQLNGSQFRYTQVAPEELTFAPLGKPNAATPKDILLNHPKGKHYAQLLDGHDHYPLLIDEPDSSGQTRVLSMPPIINADACRLRVSDNPADVFIDVTGPSQRIIDRCLNILVCNIRALAPEVTIEAVTIDTVGSTRTTPDLSPQQVTLASDYAPRVIGLELASAEQQKLLSRMGHSSVCSEASSNGVGDILVEVPAYRTDIMHPVDLVEDIAIAYGYDNIPAKPLATYTRAQEMPLSARSNTLRRQLTGLSFFETISLPLSSENRHYEALSLAVDDRAVLLTNPISSEQTLVRTHLVSGLLETLQANADHPLPQQFFEIGDVSLVIPDSMVSGARQMLHHNAVDNTAIDKTVIHNTVIHNDTDAAEYRRLAACMIGSDIGYASIRPVIEAIVRDLGLDLATPALDASATWHALYIPGRAAHIVIGGQQIGHIGEIHPQHLEHYKLSHPVALFEIDLERLLSIST